MEKTMKPFTVARTFVLAALAAVAGATGAMAAGKGKSPERQHWHFSGPFGKFDQDALQRGYQVYETVCSNCHGLELVAFRTLGQKGGPFYLESCPAGVPESIDCSNPNQNPVVRAIAENYKFQVTDGPDDFGEMFQRAPLPSDRFPGPFANEQIARLANNNAYPVDLSLITKARHYGPDYLYALLTHYGEEPPEDVVVAPGQYYNPYFSGGVLSMAPPLSDDMIEYADGSPQTVEQYSKDVTEFLMWAAEPKMEARKSLGIMSMFYLVILAGILYWSYRKVWLDVKK